MVSRALPLYCAHAHACGSGYRPEALPERHFGRHATYPRAQRVTCVRALCKHVCGVSRTRDVLVRTTHFVEKQVPHDIGGSIDLDDVIREHGAHACGATGRGFEASQTELNE